MHYVQGALYFQIRDEQGHTMPVVFRGPKPDDLDSAMEKATKIGAQGTFDPNTQQFIADNLQVKCPSKYDSAPTTRSYGASTASPS
jgi:cytochrome c-type biogenesis protein CcmE